MDFESAYREGFSDGFRAGLQHSANPTPSRIMPNVKSMQTLDKQKRKRKVRQSPKQKLLTEMTKKKWNKYKKGRGKKTYVQIRAEVSRSLEFKKKARRL